MRTYTTLDGQVLDLTDLTDEERAFFDRVYGEYRAGAKWADVSNLIHGLENPLLTATGGRVTAAVWNHPLFQAVRDIEDRVGLLQGHLSPDPGSGDPAADPLRDDFIPAPQAAARKGVTRMGLHQAIRRGDVLARPAPDNGRARLLVSVNSLARWQPNRVRQTAGAKGGRRKAAGATR